MTLRSLSNFSLLFLLVACSGDIDPQPTFDDPSWSGLDGETCGEAEDGEVDQERQARAMADPEIQAILGDPQLRSILQEMQTDPKKAQAAMNDPVVGAKLQKLIAAGVLQVK